MKTIQKKLSGKSSIENKPKPAMKWQTGDYERYAQFRCCLPYQFLLLCKLMDITPYRLLSDFMDTLDCGAWKRDSPDKASAEKARANLIDYFIEQGYGRKFYLPEDIRTIFREMDALGMLYPRDAKLKFIERHAKWRDQYQNYWFKKWYRKPRRKL